MSILEKSERIGRELRNTAEGQNALDLYKEVLQYPQEITVEFFKLVNKYYIQAHFFSVQHAFDILKANADNELAGKLVKKILAIEELNEFTQVNNIIGKFVEEVSRASFGNKVKYQLPESISYTPELVRLSNSLTVECLRTHILQQFLLEYHTKPDFIVAIRRFDELRGAKPIIPYSKEDRDILRVLKKEFGKECPVELVYSLVSMMSYIKSMIFDSFYDNIFEISEENIIDAKMNRLGNCIYNKLRITPDLKTISPNTGWILKRHNIDGSIEYGQIFKKTTHFTQEGCAVTLNVIVYDIL